MEEALIENNLDPVVATWNPPIAKFSRKYYNQICELNHNNYVNENTIIFERHYLIRIS